jgi:hypothetical protein
MRGGAIPLLAWGTILLVLYATNWIWEGRPIQVATTAFALLAIYGIAVGLWLLRRESVRRGAPRPSRVPEPLADSSLGAVLVGLSVAAILFGIVWARFLVYFGAAVLVAALARSLLEVRAQRRAREAALEEFGP